MTATRTLRLSVPLTHDMGSDRLSPIGSCQVVGQIAVFEGLRLLRSPVVWLATAASGVIVWLAWRGNPDVLDWQSVAIAGSCLPLTAVAFLKAHGAATRDRSFEVEEITEVPPTDVNRRMLGVAAAGWGPVVLSVGVVAFGVILNSLGDPAGAFRVVELLVGPAVVALGQTAGTALGRWAPHPLVAPLALVLGTTLFLVPNLLPGARTIPAASPFLPWREPYTDWVQGEPREPLVHLLYLAGLIGVTTGVAARCYRLILGGGVAAVAAALVLAGIPTGGEDVGLAIEEWGASQPRVCRDYQGVQVCAIEGYEPWFDDWSETLDTLRNLVPTQLGVKEVQQTTSYQFDDRNPAVAYVGGSWEGSVSPEARDLAIQVLAPELGLPGTPGEAAQLNTEVPACMARVLPMAVSGQARGVGFLVLSELAVPGSLRENIFVGPVRFGHIEVSQGEAALALRIAERPRNEVVATLHAHWDQLADPATTTGTLAGWFGLEPPQTLSSSSFEEMTCVCSPDGGVSCSSKEASDR